MSFYRRRTEGREMTLVQEYLLLAEERAERRGGEERKREAL